MTSRSRLRFTFGGMAVSQLQCLTLAEDAVPLPHAMQTGGGFDAVVLALSLRCYCARRRNAIALAAPETPRS